MQQEQPTSKIKAAQKGNNGNECNDGKLGYEIRWSFTLIVERQLAAPSDASGYPKPNPRTVKVKKVDYIWYVSEKSTKIVP